MGILETIQPNEQDQHIDSSSAVDELPVSWMVKHQRHGGAMAAFGCLLVPRCGAATLM